jgi:hypothetical protein
MGLCLSVLEKLAAMEDTSAEGATEVRLWDVPAVLMAARAAVDPVTRRLALRLLSTLARWKPAAALDYVMEARDPHHLPVHSAAHSIRCDAHKVTGPRRRSIIDITILLIGFRRSITVGLRSCFMISVTTQGCLDIAPSFLQFSSHAACAE